MSTTIITAYFELSPFTGKVTRDYIADAKKFTLRFPLPMMIFVEPSNVSTITAFRKELGLELQTMVIGIALEKLPLWSQLSEFQKLYAMKCDNERVKPYIPEYAVVVNSKMDLIQRTIMLDPFISTHFMWLDFGLAHWEYNLEVDYQHILEIAAHPKDGPSFAILSPETCPTNLDGMCYIAAAGLITFHKDHIDSLTKDKFFDNYRTLLQQQLSEGVYILEETILYLMWLQNKSLSVYYAWYTTLALKYHGNYPASQAKRSREDCLKDMKLEKS